MALTDNHKYLNNRGLETLWGKIESLVQSAVATLTTMINGKRDLFSLTDSWIGQNLAGTTYGVACRFKITSVSEARTIYMRINARGVIHNLRILASSSSLSIGDRQAGTDDNDNGIYGHLDTTTGIVTIYLKMRNYREAASVTEFTPARYYYYNNRLTEITFPNKESVSTLPDGYVTAVQDAVTAGSGLAFDGTTLNHSNAVTAKTSYLGDANTIPRIQIDAQGHITAYTTSESGLRQRTNRSSTSTNATLYHKLMTVKVAKGPSHQSGILEIFAGGASTPGYYYARIYYNIRNSAGSSATTCSHAKKAFKIVDGFCTENSNSPKAENFTYGWKDNAGDMDLIFYFKTTGTYNSFTYRFFFASGSTIGTTYSSSSETARDSSYTYESCEAASTVECLMNALSARNDEDGNRIKTNYLKLTGGTVTGVTTIAGVVSTSSVHASPLVVNTANSSIPYINFATGSFGNETVANQLVVRSEVSPNITAEGGAIYSTKYGWLGNYTNNTYTVSDIDGLCGMTGTGTLILPQLTSNYSIGRYFWVAPSGGSIIVSYTTQNRGTVTEAIAASSGALFVCCSGMYWAKIGGDESQSIFNCSSSQTLSSNFAYDFVNVTANNLTITLPDPSIYAGASKIRVLINFSTTPDFTAAITIKGKFGASGTTQTLAYDHLMMGSLLTFTHIRQLGRWFYNNSTY